MMRSKSVYCLILTFSVLVNCSVSCIQHEAGSLQTGMGVFQDEEVGIVSVVVSPDKEHIATSYVVSGGGAAGYVYKVVNIRGQGEPFDPEKGIVFLVTRTKNITLTWEDSRHLTIKHTKPGSILKQVREWGGEKRIRISYSIG